MRFIWLKRAKKRHKVESWRKVAFWVCAFGFVCFFFNRCTVGESRPLERAETPDSLKPIPAIDSLLYFKNAQLKYPRAKQAYLDKTETMRQLFNAQGLPYPCEAVFFRAFKMEKELELWGWHPKEKRYRLVKIYPFCNTTGDPGPKRKQGDMQHPEGFYYFDWFIPWSHRYLALEISYPNASDKILGDKTDPGGEILVHGGCTTEGCIPITDDLVKEVFIASVEAYIRGQKQVPIHQFPFRFNEKNWSSFRYVYQDRPDLIQFWEDLEIGHNYFQENRRIMPFRIDKTNGRYRYD